MSSGQVGMNHHEPSTTAEPACSGHSVQIPASTSTTPPVFLRFNRSVDAVRAAVVFNRREGGKVKQHHVASIGHYKKRDLLYPQARNDFWTRLRRTLAETSITPERQGTIESTARAEIPEPPPESDLDAWFECMRRALVEDVAHHLDRHPVTRQSYAGKSDQCIITLRGYGADDFVTRGPADCWRYHYAYQHFVVFDREAHSWFGKKLWLPQGAR